MHAGYGYFYYLNGTFNILFLQCGFRLNEVLLSVFRKIYDLMDIEINLYFMYMHLCETDGIDKHYYSFIIKPTTETNLYSIIRVNSKCIYCNHHQKYYYIQRALFLTYYDNTCAYILQHVACIGIATSL